MRVSDEGLFVIGFGRDAPPSATLESRSRGEHIRRTLTIARRDYAIERIDGLPPNMVSPSTAELARIRRENGMIASVRRQDTAATSFAAGFRWPVAGEVSGVYGSQRILTGEPRRPHFGIDIAAPAGTPVVAAAAGTVALAEADLFYTGAP